MTTEQKIHISLFQKPSIHAGFKGACMANCPENMPYNAIKSPVTS